MSRSKQRSKCTRVGCLLCKPHKASGEPTIAVMRATVDDPRNIALEEDPVEWHDDFCEWCDAMVDQGELSAHHLRCPLVGAPCTSRDPLAHRIPLSRAS